MIKILGFFDILAALTLVGVAYNFPLAKGLIIALAVYLFLKAIIFLIDIGSLFDIVGGILLVLSLSMTLPPLLLFILAGLIGFKGILSLFA